MGHVQDGLVVQALVDHHAALHEREVGLVTDVAVAADLGFGDLEPEVVGVNGVWPVAAGVGGGVEPDEITRGWLDVMRHGVVPSPAMLGIGQRLPTQPVTWPVGAGMSR